MGYNTTDYTLTLLNWTETYSFCDIDFTLYNATDGTPMLDNWPVPIIIDMIGYYGPSIKIESTSITAVGFYNLSVIGVAANYSFAIQNFTLDIIDSCMNATLSIPDNATYNISYTASMPGFNNSF